MLSKAASSTIFESLVWLDLRLNLQSSGRLAKTLLIRSMVQISQIKNETLTRRQWHYRSKYLRVFVYFCCSFVFAFVFSLFCFFSVFFFNFFSIGYAIVKSISQLGVQAENKTLQPDIWFLPSLSSPPEEWASVWLAVGVHFRWKQVMRMLMFWVWVARFLEHYRAQFLLLSFFFFKIFRLLRIFCRWLTWIKEWMKRDFEWFGGMWIFCP